MTDDRLDPRRVHHAMVAMLFDPEYATRVRGDAAVAELSERERTLLRGVDARALATDPYRRARAVTVLLEEYPVTAAVLGIAAFERFFATEAFRGVVFGRGSMALAFGGWIGERAHGVGRLEAAVAHVRRSIDDAPRADQASLRCPPRMRALVVSAGTLAYHGRVRHLLGTDPAATLARANARRAERPPQRGAEYLIVERRDDGSIDVGTGSEPLVRLLAFAQHPRSREALAEDAVRHGATPDETGELLDDLITQDLLVRC